VLTEEQLQTLEQKYQKISVVRFNGHEIVFRKPTRVDCANYRRMMSSPAEKPNAAESLAQVCIAAFDGETDVNRARITYTTVFLEDYPLFANTSNALAAISWLSGMAEDEDAIDLGKGVTCRSARLASMRAALPSGSGMSPETRN
jgi:hypothetical protein